MNPQEIHITKETKDKVSAPCLWFEQNKFFTEEKREVLDKLTMSTWID
jgi:hypothetical protein